MTLESYQLELFTLTMSFPMASNTSVQRSDFSSVSSCITISPGEIANGCLRGCSVTRRPLISLVPLPAYLSPLYDHPHLRGCGTARRNSERLGNLTGNAAARKHTYENGVLRRAARHSGVADAKWFFMGNARTILGAKIGWRELCLRGPYPAARVIEQPSGGVVWHSEPGDLDKVARENRAAPIQDWSVE
jgi:hypothetical protein